MPRNITYLTEDKQEISVSVSGEPGDNKPAIVIVHGFKGFKDWGFFPYTAGHLSSLGFFVLTFNFSHNGIGEIPDQFTEEEKFAENTISREIKELTELTGALRNGYFDGIKPGKVGILGHSRGGGISILSSPAILPECLVTWSSVAGFDRYTERQKKEWRKNGYTIVTNSRTGQEFKMNLRYLEDVEKHKNGKHSFEKSLQNYKNPFLIIHGSEDLTVKKEEAEKIYEWSDKNETDLETVDKAGHTFNCIHPFAGSNPQFEKVLKLTGDFFTKNLK